MSGSYKGYGIRMRQILLARGYQRPDGEPDVQRFCWDHRFNANHFHQWLGEKMTPFKELIRLCGALGCSAEWLLTGAERDPKDQPASGRPPRKLKNLVLVLGVGLGVLAPPPPSGGDGWTRPSMVGDSPISLHRPSSRKWRRAFGMVSA